MYKNKIYKYVGNLLIALSLCGLTYTIYPIFSIYFFPSKAPDFSPNSNKYYISIPKIHAYSEVIPNVEPWDQKEYSRELKRGIAHAKGTFFPGDSKTIFLFAHSSGSPWELTHQNTIFLRLGELNQDDIILIDYKSERFKYKVYDKKVVSPNDTKYLINTEINHLILQTCTPLGTSLKRLLIFAVPV